MYCNKFLVLGGDKRSVSLADHLVTDGKKVEVYGFSKYSGDPSFDRLTAESLAGGIKNAEIIIGPIPCCNDRANLNAPFNAKEILMKDVIHEMNKEQVFIAGYICGEVLELAAAKGIQIFDMLHRNEMAILNAIPTAEGALQISFEEMPTTLHSSNAMVLGFGRIGKILCHMLRGIGANVYAVCRKHDDAATIRSYGYTPVYFHQLNDFLGKMNVIYNTVPTTVLDKTNLKYMQKQCLLVELASKPFGIDYEAVKNEGLKVMWAQSLPGKVAPMTTAGYMKETIYHIIHEMGCGE